MERIVDALLQAVAPSLTPCRACGCDECLRARRAGLDQGACPAQQRALRLFLVRRLRAPSPRGAATLGRLAEDAQRRARTLASATAWGLVPQVASLGPEISLERFAEASLS